MKFVNFIKSIKPASFQYAVDDNIENGMFIEDRDYLEKSMFLICLRFCEYLNRSNLLSLLGCADNFLLRIYKTCKLVNDRNIFFRQSMDLIR